jgi:high frequency lysogenization protein
MQRLQNENLAAKIRVLLFAGVRAAVLWQQCGGKRWHLLFQRKRISADLKRLLSANFQNPDR